MTLLAGEALKIAEHALAGGVSPEVTGLRVLNDAGRWLVSVRPWVYLRGGMDALDLVADQDYVALPDGMGAVLKIEHKSGFSSSFILTTPDVIMQLRTTTPVAATHTFWGAVIYDHADITGTASVSGAYDVSATTAATIKATKKPTPRLDIYPMPTTSSTGGLLIHYTRGWRAIDEDTDTVFVPDWLEGVYLRAVRIWAKGYEEEDTFSKDDALDRLIVGAEYRAAVTRDSNIQMEKGVLSGGATQREGWYRSYEGSVGDPS